VFISVNLWFVSNINDGQYYILNMPAVKYILIV